MTTQFEGIVINPGSPNDGKKKASKTPFLRLSEMPLEAPAFPNGAKVVPSAERMKTADYVFVRIHHGGGADWGFWVPDGRDGAWAMDTLVSAYRRKK